MSIFQFQTKNIPAGDQPKAIAQLVEGLKKGYRDQTLLGVTGSGKTFTMANVIAKIEQPTLVIAHNKTLAAQLCNEFRELFPKNSVNYFVSYYDYYQPEAYIPSSDTYIGKEALINEEIDRLRHAATTALLTRRDVIIVASVSCIYGLGAPEVYAESIVRVYRGEKLNREALVKRLVELQYIRTNADLKRGSFRARGTTLEVMPPDREMIYRIDMGKNREVENIYEMDPVRGFVPGETQEQPEAFFSPAKHFITEIPQRKQAAILIREELKGQLRFFEKHGKLLEAERLERRTLQDIAMLQEVGYCHGIENYSRHLSGRKAGEAPDTLLNYFPENFLTIIDESHVTVSQIEGMYAGDASRKKNLIDFGFRLPSAADNRPLKFTEFRERTGQTLYTSATPSAYEKNISQQIVEQIIRPTGLTDPELILRPARGQVQDLIPRIQERVKKHERVLITTLTKRMAEDLSEFLEGEKYHVNYLHSDVKTLDRIRILTSLRKGEFDVLVGVNLLREGLDLPEVTLVAILDADKEGFLRSETSLIQTIGRAARNVAGQVVLYADQMTGSLSRAMKETERRRKIQLAYNKEHHITPKTIQKAITDILPHDVEKILKLEMKPIPRKKKELQALIREKEQAMKEASQNLEFELAAILRDEIKELNKKL